MRTGGTLPIFPALVDKGIPVVFTGFDVAEGNIHAPNERFLLDHLWLGMAAIEETLLAFGALATRVRQSSRSRFRRMASEENSVARSVSQA